MKRVPGLVAFIHKEISHHVTVIGGNVRRNWGLGFHESSWLVSMVLKDQHLAGGQTIDAGREAARASLTP